ncbi:SDR family NAD(P)-dependent oxidoreductase [Vibrio sp. 10N.237.312.C02]|uniref:SDR family NAD(P)-dependent oxidoreductase n=1 Tax=Vibrio sp. 10N.237.312.C02 TaxID=3229973 RepID=UPI00354C1B51
MQKVILLTGSTDGIGFETAKILVQQGHHVLLHGRNPSKLKDVEQQLVAISDEAKIQSYVADLSVLADVDALADKVIAEHDKINVLINNAGVFNTPNPITKDGLDVRFVVNTISPYHLTKRLLPVLDASSRVVNLSSAAQAAVNIEALEGKKPLSDGDAYAQSKLAITMWTREMAKELGSVAVNPASLLGSKMVKEAYGIAGGDLSIGSDILVRASLSDEFAQAGGQYFDNDNNTFANPHPDAIYGDKSQQVVAKIEEIIKATLS